jgi:hypothetical protein
MAVVYVRVMHGQGDDPLLWVLAVLVGGALVAVYAATPFATHGKALLAGVGAGLLLLGLLSILTIGLPILLAASLALVASARAGRRP